ncbi:hypothetical protein J437_LFUL019654 [Ladona fulva]|nr:hypothetical protein J437_LFUL019654 [Ladona fulva]
MKQERYSLIAYTDKLTLRSIRSLHGMKPGCLSFEAPNANEKWKFGGIFIKSNKIIVSLHYQQFLTGLVNNLQNRMLTTSSRGSLTSKPQKTYMWRMMDAAYLKTIYTHY